MKILLAAWVILVPQGEVTFDQAKKDATRRAAYLDRHLDAIRNQVRGWYLVGDGEDRAKAKVALRTEFRTEEKLYDYKKDTGKILADLDAGRLRVTPFYFKDALFGERENSGVLLIGKLFDLKNEDEALSILADYLPTTVDFRENGLMFDDWELDTYAPALKSMSDVSLIELHSRAAQLEKIFNGARKVSDGFRRAVISRYQATYGEFMKDFAAQQKIWDDNNENSFQLEIVEFLEAYRDHLHERMEKQGYKHKTGNKAKNAYTLVSTN